MFWTSLVHHQGDHNFTKELLYIFCMYWPLRSETFWNWRVVYCDFNKIVCIRCFEF
jgi:hypothetical protein